MLSTAVCFDALRRARVLCRVVIFLMLCAVASSAQSGPTVTTSKGLSDNKIEGRIQLPPGQRQDIPFRIRLSGERVGETSTTTDNDGRFFFRFLRPGRYTLTVDGGTLYQSVSQTVDVIELPSASAMQGDLPSQTATVYIKLRPKASAEGGAATVSAELAGVPQPAIEMYNTALKAAQDGDRKKAVEQLKGAIALHPQFVQAINGLGVQYMKLGELDKASEAFRSALKIEPEAFMLHLNYGMVLLQQKQYADADAELAHALKKGDASPTAHYYKGRALVGLQRYDDAERELQRVVALGGEEEGMAHRYLAGIYVERKDNARAASELEKYLKLVPKTKEAEQVREMIKQLRAKK